MVTINQRRSKNLLALIALLACVAAPALQKPAQAQTVRDMVQSVERHYRDLRDLTAQVTQKNVLKSIGKTKSFEATLRIKKPGRLRLDYTNGQIILVDGTSALFYSRKSEQVIKKTFTDFEQMNIPVAFLLGAARIRDDFDVLQPDQKTPRLLELLPKKPRAAMVKLRLRLDETGKITELVIFDKSGNVSELVFADIREDAGLDDRSFDFKPPEGTEIIEQ